MSKTLIESQREEIDRLNGWLDACNDREMALKEELEAAHNLARTRLDEFSAEAKKVVLLERKLRIKQGIIDLRGKALQDMNKDRAYYMEAAQSNMSNYLEMKEFADNLEERHEEVCRIHDELLKENGALQDEYLNRGARIEELEADIDLLESMKDDSDEIITQQTKEIQDLAIEIGQARYDARGQVAEQVEAIQERFDEVQADYDDLLNEHYAMRAAIQGVLNNDN